MTYYLLRHYMELFYLFDRRKVRLMNWPPNLVARKNDDQRYRRNQNAGARLWRKGTGRGFRHRCAAG